MSNRRALGEIADIVRGISFPKEAKSLEPRPGDVACLRTTNVQRQVEWDDLWFVPAGHVKRKEQYVQPGDVLISTANSYELVGKVALVAGIPRRATLGAFIALIRARDGVDSKFLYHQLAWGKTQSRIRETASTTTNISNVSTKKLAALELDVPPLEDQQDIVAELETQFSRLGEAVGNLIRVRVNLKRYKASVLKAAVEGRLVPTEAALAKREGRRFETGAQLLEQVICERRSQWSARGRYVEPADPETADLMALPDGWTWASADQLSDFITKGTTPSAAKLSEGSGDVRFLKVYNLTFDGSLNDEYKPTFVGRDTHEAELARSKVQPGDVLINIVGPPLGQVSIVPDRIPEANVNQAIARIRPVKPLSSRFIAMVLMCNDIMQWAMRRAKTTVGQANLTLELCRALPIPLPPIAEQQRILTEVERQLSFVQDAKKQTEAAIQRVERLRHAVLGELFNSGAQRDAT